MWLLLIKTPSENQVGDSARLRTPTAYLSITRSPRRRLSGVETPDTRARDGIHKLAGRGRNSRHTLQEIEGHRSHVGVTRALCWITAISCRMYVHAAFSLKIEGWLVTSYGEATKPHRRQESEARIRAQPECTPAKLIIVAEAR